MFVSYRSGQSVTRPSIPPPCPTKWKTTWLSLTCPRDARKACISKSCQGLSKHTIWNQLMNYLYLYVFNIRRAIYMRNGYWWRWSWMLLGHDFICDTESSSMPFQSNNSGSENVGSISNIPAIQDPVWKNDTKFIGYSDTIFVPSACKPHSSACFEDQAIGFVSGSSSAKSHCNSSCWHLFPTH